MAEDARAVLTDRFLDHALGLRLEDVPAETVERTLLRLTDAVGVMAVGLRAPGVAGVLDALLADGGRGEATVIGSGRKEPAALAAMANAVLMRSFDFEPVGAEGPGGAQSPAHITGTTVPVAIAMAETHGASGAELLAALIAGEDVSARIAFHSGFDVYGGQDNTGTVNIVGATLIAGRLMGLDRGRLRHALGIAVNQAAGTVGGIFDGASAFTLPMAFAARNAIVACRLAAAGVTGQRDPLAGRFGFLDACCADPDPAGMLEGLGEVFYADATIKPWSCCRAAQPAVDAAVQVAAVLPGGAADVVRTVVRLPARTANGFVGQEYTGLESPVPAGAFSVRYTVAAALRHGTVRPEHLGLDEQADPELWRILRSLELVGDLEPGPVSARVTVHTEDGEVTRECVGQALGDIHAAPLAEEAVREKFRRNLEVAGFGHAVAEAESIIAALPASLGVGGLLSPFRQ